MSRIGGLLSSGIGHDVETRSTYQSSNKNSQETRDLPNYPYRDSPFYPRDLEDTQARRDEKAFEELQNYADFQRALSDRISDDIIKDERYLLSDSVALFSDGFEDYFSFQTSTPPSARHQSPRGRLPCPIIIPQRRPEDESRGWVRAYAPDLMACGISQSVFLNFLDSFNEASKLSPYLDAVNVAAVGAGFIPLIAPTLVSKAVPAAIRLAKGNEMKEKSNTFLARANAELFAPHGLFAMIMTYRPDQVSPTSTVDTSQPFHSNPDARNVPDPSFSTNEPQLPTGAPLIFPEAKPSTTEQRNSNKLRKIGHFIADYGDRRAQARYAHKNPTSQLILNPPRTTNSPINGGLVSPFSRSFTSDRQKDMHRRRRRRECSNTQSPTPFLRRNVTLGNALEGTFGSRGPSPIGRGGNPNLIGGARAINGASGNVREGDGLRREQRMKRMGMKADVLYLMIVNNPDNDIVSVDDSDTDMDADTGVSSPVRGAQEMNNKKNMPRTEMEKELPQRGMLDPRLFDSDIDESRGPPPEYRAEVKGRYYDSPREQEYCVPTL